MRYLAHINNKIIALLAEKPLVVVENATLKEISEEVFLSLQKSMLEGKRFIIENGVITEEEVKTKVSKISKEIY